MLDKIFNLASSQRFWVYIFTLVGMVFGFPELVNNADGISTNIASQIQLIAQAIGILVTTVTLIISYAVREPVRTKKVVEGPLQSALADLIKNKKG